jgi:hypothetical protein
MRGPARLAHGAAASYLAIMLGGLFSRTFARFWAALLVLTIAVHAVAPVAVAIELRSGSAFSASTVEVAVAPARHGPAARYAPLPLPPSPFQTTILPAALLVLLPDRLRPYPVGPPAAHPAPLARKPAPRAPPIS